MAEPVNLNSDDLLAEIGRLYMEAKVRALREDQLVKALLEQEGGASSQTTLSSVPEPQTEQPSPPTRMRAPRTRTTPSGK